MSEMVNPAGDDATISNSATFAETWAEPETAALPQAELDKLTEDLIAALKTVFDPEIPVDVYELGLIYKVDLSDDKDVLIDMTLTAPGCPVAGEMPGWIEDAVMTVPGIKSARANLVFDPPWDPSKMSDEAKMALNMF
nr:SUF system Fe-S cluster assembly protein [Brevundimonas sp. LM2]